jgi:hypothetical protein
MCLQRSVFCGTVLRCTGNRARECELLAHGAIFAPFKSLSAFRMPAAESTCASIAPGLVDAEVCCLCVRVGAAGWLWCCRQGV